MIQAIGCGRFLPRPAPINTGMTTSDDERAIRALFEQTSAAWAGGDGLTFADRYGRHATVTLPGVQLRGRDAIRAGMSNAFAGPLSGSTRAHTVEHLRFLDGGTAIVLTRSVTTFPGETAPPAHRWELATWLLSRATDGWLVEAYHSSPAPLPAE